MCMCMCMSPTQTRRVEPLKGQAIYAQTSKSSREKVPSVCGVHACKPLAPSYRNHGVSDATAQRSQTRKEKKFPVRTVLSLIAKPKDPRVATAPRSSSRPGHDPRGQLGSQAIPRLQRTAIAYLSTPAPAPAPAAG
jgi:hypothetical protein